MVFGGMLFMGSEAEKLNKKSKKYKEDILRYVKQITEYEEQLFKETDENKIKKYNKAIANNKIFIKMSAEAIGNAGESIQDILPQLSLRQREIIMEVFPQGVNPENLKYADKRNNTINQIKQDIQKIIELRKEYSYSDDMPIEEKLKNKLFKKEEFLGYCLLNDSKPNTKNYNEAWNYKRDFDNAPEFTNEEREIIQKCIKNAEEREAYLDVKYAAIRGIGKSLEKAGKEIGEWGERTADKRVAMEEVKRLKEPFKQILIEQIKFNGGSIKNYTEKEIESMVNKKIIDFKEYMLSEKYKEIPVLLEQSKNKLEAELGYMPSKSDIEAGLVVLGGGKPDILCYYWIVYENATEPYIPTFIKYTNEELGLV